MYKKQIQQIFNIISVNCQRLKPLGLLKDNLGVCLFFYNYAYYQGETPDYADDILTKMMKLYPKTYIPNSSGVYELGWSIKYLDEHNFVKNDACIWEIFNSFSIKDYSMANMETDMNSPLPIFLKGLYSCSKSSHLMIEKTLSDINNIFDYLHKMHDIPLCFLISLYYCLHKCKEIEEYASKSSQLEEKLLEIIGEKVKGEESSSRDIYILHNMLNGKIPQWFHICDYNVINDIYMNWQTILYEDFIPLPDGPKLEQLEDFLSDINLHVPTDKLGLDGLCSLGINLIKKSKKLVC